MERIKPVKIAIPWYRKNVAAIQPLEQQESPFTFDLFDPDPDRRRRRRPNKPDPDPKPDPSPQPDGIRVHATQPNPNPVVVTINGKLYLDDGVFLTPYPAVDVKNPDFNQKPNNNRNPSPNIPENIPNFPTPSPTPSLRPSFNMGIPADEILLKLMDADPTYAKFVKKYTDFSLEFLWEVQNPFIVFEYPTYSQVKKLMKTFDIEKMDASDVRAFFKNEGVTGKNLNTAAVRFFIYYETLKVGQQLEDIFVPPINTTSNTKHS